MKKSNINIVARNLSDPRYRPQIVKNVKGKGTYDRKRDKQLIREVSHVYDRNKPSDFHSYRRGRDRRLKVIEMGIVTCLRNSLSY